MKRQKEVRMEKIDNPQVAFQQDHAGMKDTLEAEAQRLFAVPENPVLI
jgi:hypothetical protein